MALPQMHGRTHCPKGSDPSLPLPTANGQVLTSDSTVQCGVKWVTPAAASAVPIEWVFYTSNTNWGSGGLTDLAFTLSGGDYNTGAPTFDISGGSNPQICRTGHYQILLVAYGYSAVPGVETEIRLDFARVSGPLPDTWFSSWSSQVSGGQWSTDVLTPFPNATHFVNFDTTAFSGTPYTCKVSAWRLDAGTITAETNVSVKMAIQRLGDSYT